MREIHSVKRSLKKDRSLFKVQQLFCARKTNGESLEIPFSIDNPRKIRKQHNRSIRVRALWL